MVRDTATSIGVILYRDWDENTKCKAYFAEFGQSECVYFTKNEISIKQIFIQ